MEDVFAAGDDGIRNVVRHPGIAVITAVVLVFIVPVTVFLQAVLVRVSAPLVEVLPRAIGVYGMVFLAVRLPAAIVLKPVLFGGIAGLAAGGLDGEFALDDILRALSDGRARSLVGAYLLLEVVLALIGIGIVALLTVLRTTGQPAPTLPVLRAPLLTALLVLAYAVPTVALQFVDVAVVLDDASAWEAVRRSYQLARTRVVEVTGYTVARVLLVILVPLPGFIVLMLSTRIMLSETFGPRPLFTVALDVAGGVAILAMLVLGLGAAISVHVAYYRRRQPLGL